MTDWLESVQFGSFAKRFDKAGIDGRALLELARLSEAQPELAYKVRYHAHACVHVQTDFAETHAYEDDQIQHICL
jgi:hypothetical protein